MLNINTATGGKSQSFCNEEITNSKTTFTATESLTDPKFKNLPTPLNKKLDALFKPKNYPNSINPYLGLRFLTGEESIECIDKTGRGLLFKITSPKGDFQSVKLLAPEFASDPNEVCEFIKAAENLQSNHHPNLVKVEVVGLTSCDNPYILMSFEEGKSLREFTSGKSPIKVTFALEIMLAIVKALLNLNKRSIYPSGLTPSKVLVAMSDTKSLSIKFLGFDDETNRRGLNNKDDEQEIRLLKSAAQILKDLLSASTSENTNHQSEVKELIARCSSEDASNNLSPYNLIKFNSDLEDLLAEINSPQKITTSSEKPTIHLEKESTGKIFIAAVIFVLCFLLGVSMVSFFKNKAPIDGFKRKISAKSAMQSSIAASHAVSPEKTTLEPEIASLKPFKEIEKQIVATSTPIEQKNDSSKEKISSLPVDNETASSFFTETNSTADEVVVPSNQTISDINEIFSTEDISEVKPGITEYYSFKSQRSDANKNSVEMWYGNSKKQTIIN